MQLQQAVFLSSVRLDNNDACFALEARNLLLIFSVNQNNWQPIATSNVNCESNVLHLWHRWQDVVRASFTLVLPGDRLGDRWPWRRSPCRRNWGRGCSCARCFWRLDQGRNIQSFSSTRTHRYMRTKKNDVANIIKRKDATAVERPNCRREIVSLEFLEGRRLAGKERHYSHLTLPETNS